MQWSVKAVIWGISQTLPNERAGQRQRRRTWRCLVFNLKYCFLRACGIFDQLFVFDGTPFVNFPRKTGANVSMWHSIKRAWLLNKMHWLMQVGIEQFVPWAFYNSSLEWLQIFRKALLNLLHFVDILVAVACNVRILRNLSCCKDVYLSLTCLSCD